MAERGEEESIDILKFFIGVMCLLSLVVVGFSILNYSKKASAMRDAQDAENALRRVADIATDEDFQQKVMYFREKENTLNMAGHELAPFLQELSHRLRIYGAIRSWQPTNHRPKQGFMKRSMGVTFDGVWLEEVAKFLFYAEQGWPGMKLEEMRLSGYREKEGWKGNVGVAIYKAHTEE